MKPKVYVDTSVFSALYDERMPERQMMSAEFWARRAEFSLSTSALARDELSRVKDVARRDTLLALLDAVSVVAVSDEMRSLAGTFIQKGCFSAAMLNDALHVAAALYSGQDILVSWNFRHMVNRLQRIRVNSIAAEMGFSTIEIVAPAEL